MHFMADGLGEVRKAPRVLSLTSSTGALRTARTVAWTYVRARVVRAGRSFDHVARTKGEAGGKVQGGGGRCGVRHEAGAAAGLEPS